jgi:phosphate transport system substrate-binding protein
MVIITRRYTQQEENFMIDSFKLAPKSLELAKDAVAVIVNPLHKTLYLIWARYIKYSPGRFSKNLIPIFDGTHATSTVRFIIDSVLHGDTLTPKAMAAKSSEGVIDYVSKNPDAVGFIGVSWIGNHDDTAQLSFLKKVRMAWLKVRISPEVMYYPGRQTFTIIAYP